MKIELAILKTTVVIIFSIHFHFTFRLMTDVQISQALTTIILQILLLPLNVNNCVHLHSVAAEKHNLIRSNFIPHSRCSCCDEGSRQLYIAGL